MRTASATTLLGVAGAAAVLASGGAWQRSGGQERVRPVANTRCTAYIEQSSRPVDTMPGARLRLLQAHLDECDGDAVFLEQTLQELLLQQQTDSARALLAKAQPRRVFVAAEEDALAGWIELVESQMAYGEGRSADADNLRAKAVARAERLRAAWPEWAPAYLLLTESDRSSVAPVGADTNDRIAQLRQARTHLTTGAFVRNMNQPLSAVYAGLVTLLGVSCALFGTQHWLDRRARTALAPTAIRDLSTAGWQDRDVAVRGVLRALPGQSLLTAPFSKQPALWYKRVINFADRAKRRGMTSEHRFLVADETGQLIIDPVGFRVFTTHTKVTLGGVHGTKRTKPALEDRLMEGDTVYVRGVLARDDARPDVAVIGVDRAERHILSNVSPSILRAKAMRLFVCGLLIGAACASVLVWSDHQRGTANIPGTLT